MQPSLISSSAKISGGLIGGLVALSDRALPFLISGMLLIISAIMFLIYDKIGSDDQKKNRHSENDVNEQNRILRPFKEDILETIKMVLGNNKLKYLTICGIFYIFFTIAPFVYWQPFFYEKANSTGILGGIWIVFICAGMIGNRIAKSKWISQVYPIEIFRGTILFSGISLLIASITNNQIALSFVSFAAYHLFLGVLGPIRYMLINKEINDERRASILSFISLSENIGGGLASIIFGYLVPCNGYKFG